MVISASCLIVYKKVYIPVNLGIGCSCTNVFSSRSKEPVDPADFCCLFGDEFGSGDAGSGSESSSYKISIKNYKY